MAKINPRLLKRLEDALGVSRRRIYARIGEVARETSLSNPLAAIVFAQRQGISVTRYASAEELAEIRTASRGHSSQPQAAPPAVAAAAAKTRARGEKRLSAKKPKDNSVFVVHGRNQKLRKSIFEFLRALGLRPMEWSTALASARGVNPYIGDVLDSAMAKVAAVVVIFSADEEARLKPEFCAPNELRTDGALRGQPRPNVIFEAGLALGRHPEKTLLIQVGTVRGFTDIDGKHIAKLGENADKRNDVATRLRNLGLNVDTSGSDWMTAGDFAV